MAKQHFIKDKPHVNVGTIGHIDHGKTNATSPFLYCSVVLPSTFSYFPVMSPYAYLSPIESPA